MKNKKIIQINTVINNSTGRIMHDIQLDANKCGYQTLSIVGRRHVYEDVPCVKYGNGFSFWIHVAITTVFDRHGYGSYFHTKKIIESLRSEKPDIIHLHNIHGYYINVPMLFKYLKNEHKGKIVWTLHDLWPITGHCPYYVAIDCSKWKTGCYHCQNKSRYPISWFLDNSKKNYLEKKSLFSDVNNLTITVPSNWMRMQLKDSYLSNYRCEVINNGINTQKFDFVKGKEIFFNVKEKYSIPYGKKILLAVASIWDERKGLSDLNSLANDISDDYMIIVVGLNSRQINALPNKMIGIRRTENVDELVALYSMADIFVNPSLEESFSLVTVEAQACGCPCIVLDTSAVAELVDENNGVVLHSHDTNDYLNAIELIESRNYERSAIREKALKYDNLNMLNGYMKLYEEILDLDE